MALYTNWCFIALIRMFPKLLKRNVFISILEQIFKLTEIDSNIQHSSHRAVKMALMISKNIDILVSIDCSCLNAFKCVALSSEFNEKQHCIHT